MYLAYTYANIFATLELRTLPFSRAGLHIAQPEVSFVSKDAGVFGKKKIHERFKSMIEDDQRSRSPYCTRLLIKTTGEK